MSQALLITVRLLDGRYHGVGDWPPSPFRLFQALVCGALLGEPRERAGELVEAFGWLESLKPPVVAAPSTRRGRAFNVFVPNNDLDTVGGDPSRIAKIRATKRIEPLLITADLPIYYLWEFEGSNEQSATIVNLFERLYRLGRAVDFAFANAQVIPSLEAWRQLEEYSGAIHRPTGAGTGGARLRCPARGSFRSLRQRYQALMTSQQDGYVMLANPPRFRLHTYGAPAHRLLFDIANDNGAYQSMAVTGIARLVEQVRDLMAETLRRSFGDDMIEKSVIGRGAGESEKAMRLRILPLPSIGFEHADHAIRRVLIEVPPDCPIPVREVEWAAGSVYLATDVSAPADHDQAQMVRATDRGMLRHYGIGGSSVAARVWRTVTPAVLSTGSGHADTGNERIEREAITGHAVRQALRHAGIGTEVEALRVQREPFERRGERVERFTVPARFAGRVLRHVEITFSKAHSGPVIIGDGRYLGLGLMQPVGDASPDILSLPIDGPKISRTDAFLVARAVRRALMARSQDHSGNVPRLFSGHEPDGSPLRSGRHEHVFIVADDSDDDGYIDRIVIAAPWCCDHAVSRSPAAHRQFDRVVTELTVVRAGGAGVIRLRPATSLTEEDTLLRPSRIWESRTPYYPTRLSGLRKDARTSSMLDLVKECNRREFPRPNVDILSVAAHRTGKGVVIRARLQFEVSVTGPLFLGYDSHYGSGVFSAAE